MSKSRGQRPGSRRAGRALRRRHGPAVPDVHGPLGPGRPVEPDRASSGVHQFLHRVWTVALDPHGRDAGDQTRGRAARRRDEHDARSRMRAAAHRTLRDVTEDFEGFRWNTMVAKLMELTNLLIALPRHVGRRPARVGRGGPAAAADAGAGGAAHHRGAVVAAGRRRGARRGRRSTPSAGRTSTTALIVEATYEVPIQVNGKLRDKVTVPAGISRDRARADRAGARQGRAALDGKQPHRSSTRAAGSSSTSSSASSRRSPPPGPRRRPCPAARGTPPRPPRRRPRGP